MPVRVRSGVARRRRPAQRVRLHLEPLEIRCLLSGGPAPYATLDQAQSLGALTGPIHVQGALGSGSTPTADVSWYSFQVTQAANVTLSTTAASGQPGPVLSLYNSDPFDYNDPYDPQGTRLLDQVQTGANGTASMTDALAGGETYYVAVSGAGNLYFNPFLADSGYAGAPASYSLNLSAANVPLAPGDGPAVLSATPGNGSQVTGSPLAVRVELSGAIDPNTVIQDQTVQLTYNPTGQFGDGNDQPVALNYVNYSAQINELQLFPASALAPGYYQIFLAGNNSGGQTVLADLNGTPLGANAAHPHGQDYVATFQVTGVDGVTGSGASTPDSPATAIQLGNVTGNGLVQVAGAIGNDPSYSYFNFDPNYANPDAQVNLYHFTVSGSQQYYALTAEVFAGRIGSPLYPALSLFKADATGYLNLVSTNSGSLNPVVGTDGSFPLQNDPVVFSGLSAGDYYLAVSGTSNAPDPINGIAPGQFGVFDPNSTHSGSNGFTAGNYVLNLEVDPDTSTPQVVATSIAPGSTLDAPPMTFTVQFNKAVNLPQIAFQTALAETYQPNAPLTLDAVYVQGSDGNQYNARLLSYDPTTNTANFQLLSAVPNGAAQLVLSSAGPLGLTDLAGAPLSGGAYVVPFTVNGPVRGSPGNPLLYYATSPNDTLANPQVLGELFPEDLHTGVKVQRVAGSNVPVNGADYYQFTVSQSRQYSFALSGSGLPATGDHPVVMDTAGDSLGGIPQAMGRVLTIQLDPGTYLVRVAGWTPGGASTVSYTMTMTAGGNADNPAALTAGPAPAIALHFAEAAPPTTGGIGTATPTPTADTPEPSTALAAANLKVSPAVVLAGGVATADSAAGLVDEEIVSAGILLTRASDAVGVRAGDGTGAGGEESFVSTQALAVLRSNASGALSGGDDGEGEAGATTLVTAQNPGAPVGTDGATAGAVGGGTVVAGTPATTATLDTLFENSPLLTNLPLSLATAGPLAFRPGTRLFGGPRGERADGPDAAADGWSGTWLDKLARASALGAAALAGWCVIRMERQRRGRNGNEELICFSE